MSVDTAPLLRKKKNFAFKLETTTGTAEALTAAEGAANTFNQEINFVIPAGPRDGQGNLSPIAQIPGARSANVIVEAEMVGSGASGSDPAWIALLKASGMALNTGVLTPKTNATDTLTCGLYQNGRFKSAAGCMFNPVITLTNGQKGKVVFTGLGVPQQPSDVSIITPTYKTTKPPRVGATTFTIGGTAYRVDSIEIDLGNVVILREDISGVDSGSDATGYRAAYITDRAPRIRISPEAMVFTTKDWYDFHRSGTTAALSCVIGVDANNTFTIAAPAMQLLNPPQDGDRNGMLVDTLEFQLNRSADLGDDELTITLS
jgi:hypothetical protein